jgi:hypothetical protein
MDDYPENLGELDLDAVALSAEVVAAAKRFAASRPWRGTLEERKAKFRAAVADICRAAGVRPPRVVFGTDQRADSGRSCFIPAAHAIVLRGRLSVVTLLHEVGHVLLGPSERAVVAWSLAAFRAAFPRSFARLTFDGHMAVARRRRR